ncbi:MAG: hypothetical protein H7A14_03990 [Sinobacteraceae bacterium]|nr:hypothetical protein [Nevskiaceae bacterium]
MAYYAAMTLIPEKWLAAIRSLGRPGRELAFLLLGLVLGAVLMPALIWLAGSVVLGPYANGGFGAFCSDLLGGLREGSLAVWLVLAGPYVVITVLRLLHRTLAGIAARS